LWEPNTWGVIALSLYKNLVLRFRKHTIYLETANLVDIHNVAYYYMEPSMGRWIDYTLPKKKSNLGRPVIPITIGPHIF
jgi:hypothetical protein